ncbi:MAG: hypothetical protein U5K69_16950 [Balneolaceae bacterium]|nr:hypothetical protein [Balneolaceae bacterium]
MFNSTRTATASSTANSSFVGTSVVQGIQNETNFILYASGQATNHSQSVSYGALEQTPHNYVHGFVGEIWAPLCLHLIQFSGRTTT